MTQTSDSRQQTGAEGVVNDKECGGAEGIGKKWKGRLYFGGVKIKLSCETENSFY